MVPIIKKKNRQNSNRQPLTLLEWGKFMLCIYTCICVYMWIFGYICVFVCVHIHTTARKTGFLISSNYSKMSVQTSQASCMPSVFNIYLQNLIFFNASGHYYWFFFFFTYKTITVTLGFWDFGFYEELWRTWQVVILSLVQPSCSVG